VVDALAGLVDPDGDTLRVQLEDGWSQNGFTFDADTQTFTLDPGHPAYDSMREGMTDIPALQYAVSDGTTTVYRQVNWTIRGSNDAPIAGADAVSTQEKARITFDPRTNDRDADAGDTLKVVAVSASTKGSAITFTDGEISYTPGAAFDLLTLGQSAIETFSYTVRDGSGAESVSTVTVTVTGVADAPDLAPAGKSGTVTGTAGDERVISGSGQDVLYGLGGADQLFGGDGKDQLFGGDGFDHLWGQNGADRLDGGRGDDTLAGGNGADVFVFEGRSFGHDVVADLEEADVLEFSRSVFGDFAALRSAAHQVGGDVVISVDDSNSVTLKGILLSRLDAGDFLFV